MYSILTQKHCSPKEFVDFWSFFYTYSEESLYLTNIALRSFSAEDLRNLFVWKNGMRLSSQKNFAFERKILRNLSKVNELKARFSEDDFNHAFGELSTIWKIFLLHCIQPDIYPIFDQHVFRAMQCIQNKTIAEVAKSEGQKYSQYLESYKTFFNDVVHQSGRNGVKVDRALWFFGKSLKQPLIRKILGFAG